MGKAQTDEPSGLSIGDVVCCESIRLKSELMPEVFVSSTVRAGKGRVLVALLLGEQSCFPSDGSELVNPIEVMRKLGWKRAK